MISQPTNVLGSGETAPCLANMAPWLDILACPHCHGGLVPKGETLVCDACAKQFPVERGIPRFVESVLGADDATSRLKAQEIRARDAGSQRRELEARPDAAAVLRHEIEIAASIKALGSQASDVVVELGCGTGRLLRKYAPHVARTIAVDFSFQSLVALRDSLPPEVRNRVLLVEADICALPLQSEAFSKSCSFQVFEHLPSAGMRAQAALEAARVLRAGGRFVGSVYNWSLSKRRLAALGVGDNNEKEGFHNTGIYYYNFDETEVASLVRQAGMRLEAITGLSIPIRGARFSASLARRLNALLAPTSWGRRRSHLLLATGTKAGGQ